jgi:hypothetical protein
MSPDPQLKDEKRAPDDDDGSAKRKSDLAKEFKLTKAGVWDMYEQTPHSKFGIDIPWLSKLTRNLEVIEDVPFVWRLVKDMRKMKSCWYYLFLFMLVKFLVALQPAVALWCVVLRVAHIQNLPDTQRSGSPATTSLLFVYFPPKLYYSR